MTTSQAAAARPLAADRAFGRLAVVVVLGTVMTVLDTTVVNVAVDTLGRAFHTTLPTIQWVLTGYLLALCVTMPVTGWAIRRFGGRGVWITSLCLFAGGSVMCGLAWSTGSLVAFRAVQGVGGGMLIPAGQAMLARAAGPERLGRAMSVIAVPAMLAPVLGPVVGGSIVDAVSWRWMFFVNVPFCALALVLATVLLPRDTEREVTLPLDVTGLVLLSPAVALLVYGLSRAGDSAPRSCAGVALGVALLAAFVVHALRARDPLLDVRIFADRDFHAPVLATFVYSGTAFGLVVLLPLYMQLVRGDDPLHAGLLIVPWGAAAALTMPLGGRLTDRYGARGVALCGLLLAVLGTLAYTRMGAQPPVAVLHVAGAVLGCGHGLILPSLGAAPYLSLPREKVPAASVSANIASRLGTSVGTAVTAVLLAHYLRAGHGRDRAAAAFGHTAWWFVAMCLVAMCLVAVAPTTAARRRRAEVRDGTTPSATPDRARPAR